MKKHETDYLIIGSGAVGMAFADVILTETNADIIIVDRFAKPGGHWNVAYPFVTLHQPSAFYGVSSTELSNGKIDQVGLNKGLFDLASGAEVSAYFDNVMKHRFLPSGRVNYFPLCDYKGGGQFVSSLTSETHEVSARIKTVDATYLKTSVPSTHTPNFTVDPNAQFIPINDLPKIEKAPIGFVIVGGGKTGIDACLWLLENNVNPEKITWIVSRDAWLINRLTTQPGEQFFEHSMGGQVAQFEAASKAASIPDLFNRLEDAKILMRIDKSIKPTMFHGATVSDLELEELRRIKNVVRLGRVKSIGMNEIALDKGTIQTSPHTVHVDCSASAIANLETKPVFEDALITPQTVRSYQPVFSAAFIAYVEATYEGTKKKNQLCGVVPLPNHDTDWIKMMVALMMNQYTWNQDKELRKWLVSNRLDGFGRLVANVSKDDEPKMAILNKFKKVIQPAMFNLNRLMGEI